MTPVTDEMKGRDVKTKHGIAVIVRVLKQNNWLHIRYPDGSLGWVGEGQFTLLEKDS